MLRATEPPSRSHPSMLAPSVVRLFFWGCPAAVLRAVSRVVVNTINGLPFWGVSHVFVKKFIGHPSIAYRNPSPPVSLKCVIGGVGTPVPHVNPRCSAFRKFGLLIRNEFLHQRTRNFLAKASATMNQAPNYAFLVNGLLLPARAREYPLCIPSILARQGEKSS